MDESNPKTNRRIRHTATLILTLACITSSVLLAVSTYPGALQDILYYGVLTSILWIPVCGLLGVWYLIALISSGLKFTEWPLFRLGLAAVLLVCTYGLLRKYVPRRLAFMASRTEFTAKLAQAPSEDYHIEPLDEYVGVYRVKDVAVTPDGGTYFRVYDSGDGFWRNHTSYGFAHRPSRSNSPYGTGYYKLHPLGGGWYWFRASEESF
jgi:hypothetical protein